MNGQTNDESRFNERAIVTPPDPVMAGFWGTWQIVYTAGLEGISVGGGVEVSYHASLLPVFSIRGDWTSPQVDDPAAPGFTTAETTGAAKTRVEILQQPKLPDMPQAPPRALRVLVEQASLLPGEQVIVTYGDTRGGGPGARAQSIAQHGFEFTILVDREGAGRWIQLSESPTLDIHGGPAASLSAIAPSLVTLGETFSLAIVPLDAFGHPAAGFKSPLVVEARQDEPLSRVGSEPVEVSLQLAGVGAHRIAVCGGGLQAESNPVRVMPAKTPYNLYWGDIHGHSSLSDGLRSPDDYFGYARDVSRFDFAALTDHEPGWGRRKRDASEWERSRAKAMAYHHPGGFITFSAFEWTHGPHGHKCVYYLTDDEPVFPAWDTQYDTPAKLYAALRDRPAMVITHHPAGGPAPADLAPMDPSLEPLIEIYSCHGCSDAQDVGRQLWRFVEGRGFYVQEALDKGYRFGIVAGSDTHTSDPGNPMREHPLSPHPYRAGIMAIYADELNRQSLWDAMWARRVYGTTGERIVVDFRVNGHWMGEEISISEPPVLQAWVSGASPLRKVEVIRNGKVVLTRSSEEPDLDFSWQEDEVHTGYYYLRVTQSNGEMAWSSPIWVNVGKESWPPGEQ